MNIGAVSQSAWGAPGPTARAKTARLAGPPGEATNPQPEASPMPNPNGAPRRLRIELDYASERFVQTLMAADTVLRRYPNETQLAFSRGVRAYEEARMRA